MAHPTIEELQRKIEDLENRLEEAQQLTDAIKAGEVDAFAININNQSEIYTLQSGDYAYRLLIEQFGEGAINVTEEGLIVYTNSCFFEMLGVPYEKVVGASIFDFIHISSQQKFKELFAQALGGKSKGEVNILGDGKVIPVYISLSSLQPKLATVGIIITDFTEKKKNEGTILQYQKDLEANNLELEKSNAELASFAYIASHDLQEPLRKIQTFTNRILDKDSDTLTDGTKDYFRRIVEASTRMKNLINDLLNYSRLNTTESVYVLTDLDEILQDVKDSLKELIEEKGVTIDSGPLPSLTVIPHQFMQLFSNLVMNAIKYSKPSKPPHISIVANKVEMHNFDAPAHLNDNRKYWEIKVSDEGIGFEQEYAEKIFELFQRLHGKAEYEGTGIGLAICKRIVQNHGGYIRAIGRPGVGATFSIYLPINK